MPYYLVTIKGNADRAAGLLAVAGIHSVTHHLSKSSNGRRTDPGITTARISAESPREAQERLETVLPSGEFKVGPALPESA